MNPSTETRKLRGKLRKKYIDIFSETAGVKLESEEIPIKFNKTEISLKKDGKKNIVCSFDSGWKTRTIDGRKIIDDLIGEYNVTIVGYDRGVKYHEGVNNLTGKTATESDLYGVIKQADLFIGVDSLPLHLAAIADVPTIGIFNVTEPDHVVAKTPKKYKKIVVALLGCSPCYVGECRNKSWHKMACLNQITPEKVRIAMEELGWN
jgi:ADP-heptose:LPS heptosyltransferase